MSDSVYNKLYLAIDQIGEVPKSGYNDYHDYHYRLEEDIVAEVKQAVHNNGLIVVPSVVDQELVQTGDGFLTMVSMEFQVIDSETGDTISFTTQGQGFDGQEKGVYQAITGATKYGYEKLFMLGSGRDPEDKPSPSGTSQGSSSGAQQSGGGSGQQPTDGQLDFMYDLIDELDNVEGAIIRLVERFGMDYDPQDLAADFAMAPDDFKEKVRQQASKSDVSDLIDELT